MAEIAGAAGAAGAVAVGGGTQTPGPLICGDTPIGDRYTLTVQVTVSGSAPPFMNLVTFLCGSNVMGAVTMTAGGEGASGSRAFVFPRTVNYLIATASDGSTFPSLTPQFMAKASGPNPIVVSAWAKTQAFAPPGFGTGGAALIKIAIGATSSAAPPCNSTEGVTFALESFSAMEHPDALIYYDQGNNVWSATGPTVGGHGAAIVLTPTSTTPWNTIYIVGTKTGCAVDTGVAPGALQQRGFTGRIPIVADSVSVAEANVGP